MIGFGGDPGFDVTFSIMRIMVPVIFVLVFGIIIVTMVRGVGEWNKNNQSPKLTVPVTVVAKRSDVHRGIAGGRRLRGADLSGYPLFEFSTERIGGMKGVTVKRSGGLKISRENERIPRIEHRVHA